VAAQVVSPTKVRVTWSAASDDHGVASYRVLRDGAVVGTVSLGLTYTDTTVTAGRHTYAVVAVDTVGQQSPASVSSPGSTATVPAPAPSGLTGTYFAKNNLTTPKLTRVDKTVNFTWGTAAPAASVPKDNFSVRWTGEIIPLHNEAVTFAVTSDQGVRMWVNGQQIINDWTAHTARTDKATVSLTNNQAYSIQLEYYELTGSARMQLKWSTPTMATQVVPAAQLLSK
jgi:PA14 domain